MAKYEVLLQAYRMVIVEADNESEAKETVRQECTSCDWDIDTVSVESSDMSDNEVELSLNEGSVEIEDW